ncbi:MAG: bifunctional diaminohydroxyphosphoribosylaminopyrimidine deaminase/5-amino-6-(5-phosphoribosylamino)uracil reductase RibD [Dongiaceae bacterium]
MPTTAADQAHMRAALALARRGLGRVWPNPAVGCILVRDQTVVGRGWTQPGGRPHAETEALARSGGAARGATAYLTLEPCAHHGQTPPCADALVAAGIEQAVIAVSDPDPRVDGRGLAALRAGGIATSVGLCGAEAMELNAGFFSRVKHGRPLVTVKIASSLDGRIATSSGESRWITGPEARARVHGLRACHDALMVGTGTALTDDPALTCRLPGLADRSPVRIVLDRQLRLPLSHHLIKDAAQHRTWMFTSQQAADSRYAALAAQGVEIIDVAADETGMLSLPEIVNVLGARGITRLLVEPGAKLAASLLRADLVDRLVCFRAPMMLGSDSAAGVGDLAIEKLVDARRFRAVEVTRVGADVMTVYHREERD